MQLKTAAAAGLVTLAASTAHAQWAPGEGRTQFKLLHYQDWQPGLERIRITKPTLGLEIGLAERWQLEASAVVDTISGASPAYHNVAQSAANIDDRRRAGDLKLTWLGERTRLAAGLARSREADYDSDAVSLTAHLDSVDRNTTLSLGLGRANDRVRPVNRPGFVRDKDVNDWLLGVTRVLTANDIVQLNLTQYRGRGYFDDPYKLLDTRPDRRRQTTLLARWNHHRPALDATLKWQLRLNDDSFGLQAAMLGLDWVQALGPRWSVTPALRLHRQTAADFYRPPDPAQPPGALPIPPGFVPGRTLNSFDPRLGAFTAVTTGVKLEWQPAPGWLLEWKTELYRQTRTPTPLHARWHQVGVSRGF